MRPIIIIVIHTYTWEGVYVVCRGQSPIHDYNVVLSTYFVPTQIQVHMYLQWAKRNESSCCQNLYVGFKFMKVNSTNQIKIHFHEMQSEHLRLWTLNTTIVETIWTQWPFSIYRIGSVSAWNIYPSKALATLQFITISHFPLYPGTCCHQWSWSTYLGFCYLYRDDDIAALVFTPYKYTKSKKV